MKLKNEEETEREDFFVHTNDLIPLVKNLKKSGSGWTGLCQSHDDRENSLSITRGDNGRAIVFCHAECGGDYERIFKGFGLWKDELPKKVKTPKRLVKTYDYLDEDGKLVYQVCRYEPKWFSQRAPDGNGGWLNSMELIPRVLYRLPELINSESSLVFVVGGEKDVDRLHSLGLVATTNSSGEGKWKPEYNKYLKGKDVVVIADNDKSGYAHADLVSKQIYRSANTVKLLSFPELQEKGDVSDWLDIEDNTVSLLLDIIESLEPISYLEEELDFSGNESHNIEAEMAVLGAILKNDILITKAIDADAVKHFYNPRTKKILGAMLRCFEAKHDINYVTVGDALGNDLEKVGGYEFLKSLEKSLPVNFNIDSWLSIIVAKSQYRELVALGKKVSKIAENESDTTKNIVNELIGKAYHIQTEDSKEGFTMVGEGLEDVILKARNNADTELSGIPTGFLDLDEVTSGYQDTDLIIVAARPSMGKTALCLNSGVHSAMNGYNTALFPLEMSKEQLIQRILCTESFVNSFDFRNGRLGEDDWLRITNVLPKLNEASLFIDDTPSLSFNELRAKSLQLKQELEHNGEKLHLIIVDYLQLMRGEGKKEGRFQEISQLARDLKALAKELRVPIIVLSQLSRAPEARTPPRPIMSDLRESGEIEQAADIVAFIYREEYYNPSDENRGLAELIIAKNRNGPTGTVYLAFIKQFTKFMNLFQR